MVRVVCLRGRVFFRWGLFMCLLAKYSLIYVKSISMCHVLFLPFLDFYIPFSEVRIRDKNLLNTVAPSPVFTSHYTLWGRSSCEVGEGNPGPSLPSCTSWFWKSHVVPPGFGFLPVKGEDALLRPEVAREPSGRLRNTDFLDSPLVSHSLELRICISKKPQDAGAVDLGTRLEEHLAKSELANSEKSYHDAG